MKHRHILATLLALLIPIISHGQCSSMGRDFWVSYPHFQYQSNIPIMLTLYASADETTNITVTNTHNNYRTTFTVVPRQVTSCVIPNNYAFTSTPDIPMWTALHVTSDHDISLFAIHEGAASIDLTNVLPTNKLGADYMVQSYPGRYNNNYRSQIVVVATVDSTVVDVHFNAPAVGGHAVGSNASYSMQAGQSLLIIGDPFTDLSNYADLTGSTVHSRDNKPVAVFASHGCAYVPTTSGNSCDLFFDQSIPIFNWGTDFVVRRTEASNDDHLRILSQNNNCQVSIGGNTITTLNAGEVYDYPVSTHTPLMVHTSQPAAVCQLMGSGGNGQGDPAMIHLTPVDHLIDHNTFGAHSNTTTNAFWVIITTTAGNASHILLDNSTHTSEFMSVTGTSDYITAHIPISAGTHTITTTNDAHFCAYFYGLGPHVGYIASAGSGFQRTTDSRILVNGHAYDSLDCCQYDPELALSILSNTDIEHINWYVDGHLSASTDELYLPTNTPRVYDVTAHVFYPDSNYCLDSLMQICHLRITIHPTYDTSVFDTIPASILPWSFHGITYTDSVSGDSIHLTSQYGCDSLILYNLAIYNDTNYLEIFDTICGDAPYQLNGFDLPADPERAGSQTFYQLIDSALVTSLYLTRLPLSSQVNITYEMDDTCIYLTVHTEAGNVHWTATPPDNTLIGQESQTTIHVCPKVRTTYYAEILYPGHSQCDTYDSISISTHTLTPDEELWIPNVFTPDLVENNRFKAIGKNIEEYNISIFRRQGDIVFHSNDINEGWDGTHNGIKCPEAAYVYLIYYRSEKRPKELQRRYGTFLLLR